MDDLKTSVVGKKLYHDSSSKQVTGEAIYVDDISTPEGTLHAALVTSPCAYGKLKGFDLKELDKLPYDTFFFSAKDIPGENDIGPIFGNEPIFAEKEFTYFGQPVGVVITNNHYKSMHAAKKIKVVYNEFKKPILDIDEAFNKKSFFGKPLIIETGNVKEKLEISKNKIKGSFYIGGQDHFYLEGQISLSIPNENQEFTVWSSTQHPTEVQHGVSNVLKLPSAKIDCKTRRLGGGFGGKESQATIFAAISALGAHLLNKPVKLRLDRFTDMTVSGKRHDFKVIYDVGFKDDGKINAIDIKLLSNGGNVLDLSGPVMTRALTHLDNCYSFKNFKAAGYICKTNTVSNTAFRGFGGPQGMLAIESIMGNIANYLNLALDEIRNKNFYSKSNGFKTPYGQKVTHSNLEKVLKEVKQLSKYKEKKSEIKKFNDYQILNNLPFRKGIAIVPAKFGISFNKPSLNQAGALINVYSDGSIRLNHGGTEMGQGLFIKVAQVVAECFGVSIEKIHITPTNTAEVPNTSATAASSGSDLNGMAAWKASETIKKRMIQCAKNYFKNTSAEVLFRDNHIFVGNKNISFNNLAKKCWEERISLSSTGFYKTPKIHWDQNKLKGRPYFYYTWGASVSESILDIDTGETRILNAYIVEDCGKSLNEAIDIGQVEGGFVQGLGWLSCEELFFNQSGKLLTVGPSTYKIPGSRDIPREFKVKLLDKTFNEEKTIFRSKAVGEPPLLLAISHFLAIKNALSFINNQAVNFDLSTPLTPSNILNFIKVNMLNKN